VTWLLALLSIGALVRLTRLVTGDQITEGMRDAVDRHFRRAINGPPTMMQRAVGWSPEETPGRFWQWVARHFDYGYLVSCPWCASIWLAPLAVLPVWFPTNRLILAAALGLTASLVAGHVQAREPDTEDPSE
jgi:hypothetical protein